ncbi:hypothetical protein BDV33DRAFT_186008, partial [Aspergillus novoparasiticus]
LVTLTTMVGSLRNARLQFTSDEYNAMEGASQDLAKIANSIADGVKGLGKRRRPAIITEV